jgi:hypothetical protein
MTVWFFLCECFLINICPSVRTVRSIWATGGWNRKWRARDGVLKLIAVTDCDGTACDGPPVYFGTEPHGKSECVCFTSFGKPRDTICNLISFLFHFLQHILTHSPPSNGPVVHISFVSMFGSIPNIALSSTHLSLYLAQIAFHSPLSDARWHCDLIISYKM